MKLDILVFAAHPDDAELGCSGTIAAHVDMGYKVGIIDLTRGELGTRGTVEIRATEAANASKILGVAVRENLGFRDGFFLNDEINQLEVIKKIRQYQPEIVIANAVSDRHPDHGRAAQLVSQASFLAGLSKIETISEGDIIQIPWRPKNIYHYIQSNYIKPDFIVDISRYFEKKMESIKVFSSQFYDPDNGEPNTFISSPEFMDFIVARSAEMGKPLGYKYAEGFTTEKFIGVKNLMNLE